jgi:predicted TIM-barrel fold metal-dependent hydrolase
LDYVKHLQERDAFPRTVRDGDTYFVQCAAAMGIPCLPTLVDLDEKLRQMEELRVDVSVLSHGVPLGPDALLGPEADEWASRINDDLARLIQQYPTKFVGLGTLGFGDVDRSVAEVDRCINELGFKGFQVFSNTARKMLRDPDVVPVLERIGELGVPVHLHPAIPLNAVGMDSAGLFLALGFPYDTSLNAVHLIQSGFFDRLPDFKLILAHVGGLIPYLKGRLEAYSVPSNLVSESSPMRNPLKHYLERLYVDTVCYHVEALECCYKSLGARQLLYGTDHPFGAPRTAAELVEQLDCSAADRELIYHGNAERLFGLPA